MGSREYDVVIVVSIWISGWYGCYLVLKEELMISRKPLIDSNNVKHGDTFAPTDLRTDSTVPYLNNSIEGFSIFEFLEKFVPALQSHCFDSLHCQCAL